MPRSPNSIRNWRNESNETIRSDLLTCHNEIVQQIMLNWNLLKNNEKAHGFVKETVELCQALLYDLTHHPSDAMFDDSTRSAQISSLYSGDGCSFLSSPYFSRFEPIYNRILNQAGEEHVRVRNFRLLD